MGRLIRTMSGRVGRLRPYDLDVRTSCSNIGQLSQRSRSRFPGAQSGRTFEPAVVSMTAGMEADVFGVDPHGINEHDPNCDFRGQSAILPMPIATWLE
jgi:hypothetical protein